ncbi:MAG: hypothetical protein K2H61_02895 [Muribaculaceae bacterium]|nr:hypothetical protein [Muribaculaceae bacterium]
MLTPLLAAINSPIANPSGFFDHLCNFCIDLLTHLSHITGLSYGLINILLFIIIGPLCTLLLATSTIILLSSPSSRARLIARLLAIAAFILMLLVILILAYAAITLP